jgi:MtN3 and saliva related transmembrane protein
MTTLFALSPQAVQAFGYVGTFLTSVTFIPQVIQAWKTKSVGDLNTLMILIVITSTLVWLVYGFGITDGGPVIVANFVVLSLALILLYFKLTFPKK